MKKGIIVALSITLVLAAAVSLVFAVGDPGTGSLTEVVAVVDDEYIVVDLTDYSLAFGAGSGDVLFDYLAGEEGIQLVALASGDKFMDLTAFSMNYGVDPTTAIIETPSLPIETLRTYHRLIGFDEDNNPILEPLIDPDLIFVEEVWAVNDLQEDTFTVTALLSDEPEEAPLLEDFTVLVQIDDVDVFSDDPTFAWNEEELEVSFTWDAIAKAKDEQVVVFSVAYLETAPKEDSLTIGVATYTLTLDVVPEGAGTVMGEGVYEEDEEVTVIAEANEGYYFVNWTKDGVEVSTDLEYSFVMLAEDKTLVANFEETVRLEVKKLKFVARHEFLLEVDEYEALFHVYGDVAKITLRDDTEEEKVLPDEEDVVNGFVNIPTLYTNLYAEYLYITLIDEDGVTVGEKTVPLPPAEVLPPEDPGVEVLALDFNTRHVPEHQDEYRAFFFVTGDVMEIGFEDDLGTVTPARQEVYRGTVDVPQLYTTLGASELTVTLFDDEGNEILKDTFDLPVEPIEEPDLIVEELQFIVRHEFMMEIDEYRAKFQVTGVATKVELWDNISKDEGEEYPILPPEADIVNGYVDIPQLYVNMGADTLYVRFLDGAGNERGEVKELVLEPVPVEEPLFKDVEIYYVRTHDFMIEGDEYRAKFKVRADVERVELEDNLGAVAPPYRTVENGYVEIDSLYVSIGAEELFITFLDKDGVILGEESYPLEGPPDDDEDPLLEVQYLDYIRTHDFMIEGDEYRAKFKVRADVERVELEDNLGAVAPPYRTVENGYVEIDSLYVSIGAEELFIRLLDKDGRILGEESYPLEGAPDDEDPIDNDDEDGNDDENDNGDEVLDPVVKIVSIVPGQSYDIPGVNLQEYSLTLEVIHGDVVELLFQGVDYPNNVHPKALNVGEDVPGIIVIEVFTAELNETQIKIIAVDADGDPVGLEIIEDLPEVEE